MYLKTLQQNLTEITEFIEGRLFQQKNRSWGSLVSSALTETFKFYLDPRRRIRSWSSLHVEMTLLSTSRWTSSQPALPFVVTSATEAVRLLLFRNLGIHEFHVTIKNLNWIQNQSWSFPLDLKLSFSEAEREKMMAGLSRQQKVMQEFFITLYDRDGKQVEELSITAEIGLTPLLEWK